MIETDTDKLQEAITRLVRRWRSLSDGRRQDFLNSAAVYTFAVLVVVGSLFVLLGTTIGATTAFLVVVVMVMLGALGAFLAGRRGRSRAAWAVVCFLLPIVGLLVLLLIPDRSLTPK